MRFSEQISEHKREIAAHVSGGFPARAEAERRRLAVTLRFMDANRYTMRTNLSNRLFDQLSAKWAGLKEAA